MADRACRPSEQRFGAVGVENRARIHFGRHAEGNAGREVGLDQSGDHVDRSLGRQNQVNADRARHLCEPCDRLFHVAGIEHHQVGQLVDDDDDVGNRPSRQSLRRTNSECRSDRTACCTDRYCGRLWRRAASIAVPFRGRRCAARWQRAWAGDDRRVKVRNAFVVAEFEALGVDQDQAYLVGRGFLENGHDHRIDSDALAHAIHSISLC